jgi:hypothetical protein
MRGVGNRAVAVRVDDRDDEGQEVLKMRDRQSLAPPAAEQKAAASCRVSPWCDAAWYGWAVVGVAGGTVASITGSSWALWAALAGLAGATATHAWLVWRLGRR